MCIPALCTLDAPWPVVSCHDKTRGSIFEHSVHQTHGDSSQHVPPQPMMCRPHPDWLRRQGDLQNMMCRFCAQSLQHSSRSTASSHAGAFLMCQNWSAHLLRMMHGHNTCITDAAEQASSPWRTCKCQLAVAVWGHLRRMRRRLAQEPRNELNPPAWRTCRCQLVLAAPD
jgi:hypothetical protein